MAKEESFELSDNEIILLQSKNASSENSTGKNELILTDKRIIYITRGLFGKIKNIDIFPLSNIAHFSGEPRIETCRNDSFEFGIRVGFKNQIKTFFFEDRSKKVSNLWANTIYKAITGMDSPSITSASDGFLAGIGVVADTLKGTVDTLKKTFGNKMQQTLEKRICKCASCGSRLVGIKGQIVKCPYCDTDQKIQ